VKSLLAMIEAGMETTPEAVMMNIAYNKLAEAYIACYRAVRLVMDETARMFGWEQFRIDDPQLRNYMDEYFLGRPAGETKIPQEEKQVLQFLMRGCLAGVDLEQASRLIRLGMDVVKYRHIYEVLGITGAHQHYIQTLAEYSQLYNSLNETIRTTLSSLYAERKEAVVTVPPPEGRYAPCFIMPSEAWESGSLSKEVSLEPLYQMPVFPRANFGALQTVYGRLGSGKTLLLSSIACYSVLDKRELVFSPLNDKSNSFSLACLLLLGYNRRTKSLVEVLQDLLGLEPQAVPTLTLTVLRKEEKIYDLEKNPPTVFDRILEVENPRSFPVDFDAILDELKTIAQTYHTINKPTGIVNVRNLDRFDADANVNIDVQAASNLLVQFDKWRKGNLSIPARVVIDEVSYLAPSQISLYGGDALRSSSTISDFIKESRRNLLSVDLATQMPLEILPDIRNASTNIFFRDLALSRDKSRSQIDFLLDSLQLEDPTIKTVVRDINNRGTLGMGYWFWYHQPARRLEVVKPSPPLFCLQDPEKTPRELLKLYEKETAEKLLLDSWREVPRLKAPEEGKKKTLR